MLLEAHRAALQVLAKELAAECRLPLAWYDALAHLGEAEGRRLRMHALADAVLLSDSGITRIVERMEAAGLVRRRMAHDDRRAVEVALTPKGLRLLRRAWRIHARGIARHFGDHVTVGEAKAVTRALRKVRDAARLERAST